LNECTQCSITRPKTPSIVTRSTIPKLASAQEEAIDWLFDPTRGSGEPCILHEITFVQGSAGSLPAVSAIPAADICLLEA
jgi:hypothetical protein